MSSKLIKIEKIYTDGACSGNPGPGGWGVVCYLSGGQVHELGGAAADTTNNRMELQAAIAALEFLNQYPQAQPVHLFTDSEYVKKGATQWMTGWKRRGWKTAQGKAVLNQDLWVALDTANPKKVEWFYVRGHSGDPGNDRCDEIAKAFSLHQSPQLIQSIQENLTSFSEQSIDRQSTNKQSTNKQSTDKQSVDHQPKLIESPMMVQPSLIQSETKVRGVQEKSSPDLSGSGLYAGPQSRLQRLRELRDILNFADEIARKGYLISSPELADLLQLPLNRLPKAGEDRVWRNWHVCWVKEGKNEVWWRLEANTSPEA